jgi:hypothetical protein
MLPSGNMLPRSKDSNNVGGAKKSLCSRLMVRDINKALPELSEVGRGRVE